MAENGKFYWLKLKRDFFKRHDIRIIEEMPNGKDYILFYLKLLLESVDHEGELRFSDTIPYNENMLSVVTNTNIDIVRAAMRLFIDLQMMTVFDDKTIYMTEVEKLIGSETKWAEYKRKKNEASAPRLENFQSDAKTVPIELETKKESRERITTTTDAPTRAKVFLYFKEMLKGDAANEAEKFYAYNNNRGWDCLPNWTAAADLWIARIKEKV
jgi:predicted phage replisome organizer